MSKRPALLIGSSVLILFSALAVAIYVKNQPLKRSRLAIRYIQSIFGEGKDPVIQNFDPEELRLLGWTAADASHFFETHLRPRYQRFKLTEVSCREVPNSPKVECEYKLVNPDGRPVNDGRTLTFDEQGAPRWYLYGAIVSLWVGEADVRTPSDVPKAYWKGFAKDATTFEEAGLKGLVSPPNPREPRRLKPWSELRQRQRQVQTSQ